MSTRAIDKPAKRRTRMTFGSAALLDPRAKTRPATHIAALSAKAPPTNRRRESVFIEQARCASSRLLPMALVGSAYPLREGQRMQTQLLAYLIAVAATTAVQLTATSSA